MTGGPPYSLGRELPPAVQAARGSGWDNYRRYPVFGWRWLVGRTRLFAAVIAVIVVLLGMGIAALYGARNGLVFAAVQFLAFFLFASIGPALATWVRQRHLPAVKERRAVIAAILVGMLLSGVVDAVASWQVTELLGLAGERPGGVVRSPLVVLVNLLALAFIYGLFGGGLALRAYFSEHRRWRDWQQEEALQEARHAAREGELRLGVLQAQVEPHFLFNTLASIRALMRRDPDRAERTLDALVEHLRASIPKLRGVEAGLHSTLGQQLDLCAGYLEVMRLRTGDRLEYAISADPESRALAYPPLLLITLVENAVKHGIEPKPGRGRIEVVVERDGGNVRVRILDDGVGLRTGFGNGVGLANVRAQLETRYGGAARLTLANRPEGGAEAAITTPLEIT